MARFKRHVLICENERAEGHPRGSCARGGSAELTEVFKEELRKRGMATRFRANKSGCLDACEFGPVVVVYPDAVWYGGVTVDDVVEIIESHIIGGQPVERLIIKDKRFLQEFE
ncbi:MAG: (2Fe-2S) ferredoxin domain-containing protein [Bacteroidetes bacterium]|nr:(2Fe-2S) ferredoxin domain-containing protein [Bacteroidota bacterium]